MQASPHLHFKGNCREAFDFYAATLRGRIAFAMTYGESPAASQTPPEVRDQIIHARLEFGNQAIMGCDPPRERFQPAQGFNVLLTVQDHRGRARLRRARARGQHQHALRANLLGLPLRHVHGPLRDPVDGELRAGALNPAGCTWLAQPWSGWCHPGP